MWLVIDEMIVFNSLSLSTEFSLSRTSGPYATLGTCRYAKPPSNLLFRSINTIIILLYLNSYIILLIDKRM